MAPSLFNSSLSASSSPSSLPTSTSTSTPTSSLNSQSPPQAHSQPMVLPHSQLQQQYQPKRSSTSTSTSTALAAASAARRPSPTEALKHLRPAIPSPNTLLASLLANPDAHQLDFLSLFDPPATLPSDLLNNTNTKDSPANMDEYYGSAGYPAYPPTTSTAAAAYAQRRFGLPSVSPTGTGSRAAPAAAGGYPQASYPYSAYPTSNLGQYPASAASQHAAALRLHQQQQASYADAFRTARGQVYDQQGYPQALQQQQQQQQQVHYAQPPRSGVNGYMDVDGGAQYDNDDAFGIMSAAHLAHARAAAAAAAAAPTLRQVPSSTPAAAVDVVNPSALEVTHTPAASASTSTSSTALTLHHDSTPNHAVRLRYAPDGRSLVRADHTHHACQDPMVLGGRLVDMSVHMEHYLQDLLPRKGEDHSDWQPVDITFDILSSRLRQTLEQMERFRGDMTRKASVERKKVAERESRGKGVKRLQGSRAGKAVAGLAAGSSGGNANGKAARSAGTDSVRN